MEHGRCIRVDVVYEDGTVFRFSGDAAQQHHDDLNAACAMAGVHGWNPREPRLPPTELRAFGKESP